MTTLACRKAQAAARRAAVPLSGLLAVGLLATGCGAAGYVAGSAGAPATSSTSGSAALPQSGAPSAAAQTPSPAATSVAGSTEPGSQPAAPGPGQCPAKALKITMGRGDGAAGSIYYPLEFTNASGVTCTMYGYPGVAFVTRPGDTAAGATVLGAPAVRESNITGKPVTLVPGATAHASLRVQVAQSYPVAVCKPVTGRWLQVYPPGSYAPRYIRFTAVTCTGKIPSRSTLGIYVVQPGATGP